MTWMDIWIIICLLAGTLAAPIVFALYLDSKIDSLRREIKELKKKIKSMEEERK